MLYMGENAHADTSKNSAKLKQYYYFHAEFLEEVRYMLDEFKYSNFIAHMPNGLRNTPPIETLSLKLVTSVHLLVVQSDTKDNIAVGRQ